MTWKKRAYVLGLGLFVWIGTPLQADLNLVPGLTDPQIETAAAVQTVCPLLGAAGGAMGTLPPLEQDLFERCRELVQTSNDQQGMGPMGFSLGLSEADLAAALQQVGHEEAITQGTMSTETSNGQLTNLNARLAALRRGATGVSISSLSFAINGQMVPLAKLGPVLDKGAFGGGGENGDSQAAGRLGFFVNGTFGFGDRDATAREDGFDFDTRGLAVGIDYRFTDSFVFGGAVGYGALDADLDVVPTVAGGKVEADELAVSAYGTYYNEKVYVDGVATFGQGDYEFTRNIFYMSETAIPGTDRAATGDTDGDRYSLTVSAGYEAHKGALTVGPHVRVSYLELEIDGYTEQGALGLDLQLNDQDVESLLTSAGVQFSYAASRGFGVLIPQWRVEWHHEFDDDSRSIMAQYAHDPFDTFFFVPTDNPDRDFFAVGVGLSAVLKGGNQAFFDYDSVFGLDEVSNSVVTAGFRLEF